MMAPAAVSWAAHLGCIDLRDTPLAFLGATPAIAITSLLAIGELVADKLPSIPNRTEPGSLAARAVSGALCGAALCAAAKESAGAGAVLGGLGAVAGAFAGYEIRRKAVRALEAPDFTVALAEDAVAIGSAALFVR